MGGSCYSHDTYVNYASLRSHSGKPVFGYDASVKSGKVASVAHSNMDPKGVIRECRDSDAHPVTIPIGIIMDTTGSMMDVPPIIESKLPSLMGTFLDDKASGKKYLGDAYPSILIGAVDDFEAMRHGSGTLQIGQFESGIEIDYDLEKIWLTGRGGGTYEESYELALYFFLHKTKTDHWEKRGKKGYLFLIGDEHPYPEVSSEAVETIIGDKIQSMDVESLVKEVKKRYNVFFILPNMTQHYTDESLFSYWVKLLGQQNVLRLENPEMICELISSAVAINEGKVDVSELTTDGIDFSVTTALSIAGVSSSISESSVKDYHSNGLPISVPISRL